MAKEIKGIRLIFGYLGLFVVFEGLIVALPLLMLAFYPSEYACWPYFVTPAAGAILFGILLFIGLIAGRKKGRFAKNEESLLLVIIWVMAIVLGAMPFFLANLHIFDSFFDEAHQVAGTGFSMTFSESIFEATSGYTTTGLTVYNGFLDSGWNYCNHVYLFHRAEMQFIGGVGLVLIVSSVISNRFNVRLYGAEGHNDQLLPSMASSAKLIFGIYALYIVAGALALWICGMEPFDALCFSISALATGGFASKSTSIAYYETRGGEHLSFEIFNFTGERSLTNPIPVAPLAMEIVTIVLMLLGSINFVLHTFLLTFKWKRFAKDIEVKTAFWMIFVFTALATAGTFLQADPASLSLAPNANKMDFVSSFRYGFFATVSSLSTTGYGNFISVADLGEAVLFCTWICMLVGGGMGATAGSLKQYRFGLIVKDMFHSFKLRTSSPRANYPNTVYRLGELKDEDPKDSEEAHHYLALYIIVIFGGALAMAFLPGLGEFSHGSRINSEGNYVHQLSAWQSGMYMFLSAISSTGLSVVDFAAYQSAHARAYMLMMWILTVGMFLGRLEILPLYYGIRRILIDPWINLKAYRQAHKKLLKED